MRLDDFSNPIYSSKDIENFIYQNRIDILDKIFVEDSSEVNKFNKIEEKLQIYYPSTLSKNEFDASLQEKWFMPYEYKNMDIESYLVHVCPKENYQRLIEELQEFRSRNMINLLRWLKYFTDMCRNNNIVWGVGRGSSVASYTLFLLGVHKIDSVKFKLDWKEFLR